MPSPAAAASLAGETLPMRADDGVTLPATTGERDSHAVDSHYADDLPMEPPVARPALTPGESAAMAEHEVARAQLVDNARYATATAGGVGLQ
jgi:hypothetical protein